jgi:hypothetical protein
MKRSWGVHIGVKLLESNLMLFVMESDPACWVADQKRLKRMKAEWVRVGCPGHPGVVIGAAEPPIGKAIHNWGEATKVLGKSLRELAIFPKDVAGGRIHPITSSAGWRQPSDPPKYQRIGWINCVDPEKLQASLRDIGIAATYRPVDAKGISWDVSWVAPAQDDPLMLRLEGVLAECV